MIVTIVVLTLAQFVSDSPKYGSSAVLVGDLRG
jgi:hypothetical protein